MSIKSFFKSVANGIHIGDPDNIMVSKHKKYTIYFSPNTKEFTNLLEGKDVLVFKGKHGWTGFWIAFSDARNELGHLLKLLRKIKSTNTPDKSKNVGLFKRLVLRLYGRSIIFAEEFSFGDSSNKNSPIHFLSGTKKLTFESLIAQVTGWKRPGALLLTTSQQNYKPNEATNTTIHKFLSFKDCNLLADGIEKLLADQVNQDKFTAAQNTPQKENNDYVDPPAKNKSFSIKSFIFGFICLLAAVVFLGLGAWSLNRNRAFVAGAKSTTGAVVAISEHIQRNTTGKHHTQTMMYAPVIKFHDYKGKSHKFTSRSSSSNNSYRVGQKVEVLYSPANPASASLNSFSALYLGPVIALIIGFIALGIGIFPAVIIPIRRFGK